MTNAMNTGIYGRVNPGPGFGDEYSYTDDAVLTAAQDGAAINNAGAAKAIEITLPAAVAGMEFPIDRVAPFAIVVTADGSDVIGLGNPGGSYVLTGDGLTVFACTSDTAWRIAIGGNKSDFLDIRSFGADPTGVNDSTAAVQAAHDAAAASTPIPIVAAPFGAYKISSTVTLKASMHGLGGNGYAATMGRAVFVPTITDGTACLKALDTQGLDLRSFAVQPEVSGTVNPHPSSGNVQNCIGLQLGKAPALISAVTLPTTTTALVTTKYLHTYETGDSVVASNVAGLTGGAAGFTGGTYTVTRVSSTQFSLDTSGRVADNSVWTAYSGRGMVYSVQLGGESDCSRGVVEDVTVQNCNVAFHICGWLNKYSGLKALYSTLGLDGGYLNTCVLDLVTENCYQSVQLLGCNDTSISRIEDEGSGTGRLGAPSTIDYSAYIECAVWATEGTRSTNTPWLTIGGVTYTNDIHIRGGHFATAPGGAVSVAVDRLDRFTLPVCRGGYSTTANTTSMKGTATFAAATTVAVAFPTTQYDAVYRVMLTPQADPVGRLWVSSKATTGFTINNSSSTSIAVDWQVVRED